MFDFGMVSFVKFCGIEFVGFIRIKYIICNVGDDL